MIARSRLRRRSGSHRRRALLAAITSGGLLLVPATARQGRAAEPFVNGVAKASAVVTKIAPGVGSLELGLKNGIAVADLRNQLAQSQAQTADLGLIGSSLTGESCGSEGSIKPEDLPQPTRIDNRQGDAAASDDEAPLAGSTLGAGHKEVSATTKPSSSASATIVQAGVPPLVSIGGGRSTASTEVVPGKARIATATVDANLDLGGVFKLGGMHWSALHRTGEGAQALATFNIAEATAGGVPLPADQLATVETTLNTALAASGISLSFPRIERVTKPVDFVRVTPLRVQLKDSPVGKTVLGPVLNNSREQREQLFNQLTAAFCQAASTLFVGGIGVDIAAGNGFLTLDIGGAEASTAAVEVGNPFGDDGGLLPVPLPEPPPVPSGGGGPVVVPRGDGVRLDSGGAAAPATVDSGPPQVAIGPTAPIATKDVCESIHDFHWPDCSRGAAIPLGLAGLVVALGFGAADLVHQRRRKSGRGVLG